MCKFFRKVLEKYGGRVAPQIVKVAPQSGEIAHKFEKVALETMKVAPPSMNGKSIPKLQLDSYFKKQIINSLGKGQKKKRYLA